MKGISFIATHRMGDHTFRSTLAMNVVRNLDIWKHRNGAEGFGYPEDDLRSYADSQQRTLDLVGEV
jgi:hypothetical protein